MKLRRNVIRSNMTLVYWWTHWFWVTAIMMRGISATPVPLSSYETISTSLKSALVQNDNTFQQASGQPKVTAGSKSVPLTFETSDSDSVFGGAGEIDAESIAKNTEWLSKPGEVVETTPMHDKLGSNETTPGEIVAALSLPNINSTNNSTSQTTTTLLSSVTETAEAER